MNNMISCNDCSLTSSIHRDILHDMITLTRSSIPTTVVKVTRVYLKKNLVLAFVRKIAKSGDLGS